MKESITNNPNKRELHEREEVKKVTVFLNTGQCLHIFCKEAKFEVNPSTGVVTSYIFTGVRLPEIVNIRIDAIVAYTIMNTRL
ncbi:hypothetical protein EMILIAHAH_216 [Bacillus phage vB_BanH_Emiliahah]|nr:hypothetical protein EMILIAHAH_216 [Bacillus phage vB_BanH_Emiliahah]